MKPRLLDLFCGAGGAGMGYHRAGFDVVGVDLADQPNYPFQFIRADALPLLESGFWGYETACWRPFDAIHASPPCQRYSLATGFHPDARDDHPDLIDPTRAWLEQTGLPYVIENVPGAPLRRDLVLCGEMFGLRVHRHRWFECGGWTPMRLQHQPHRLRGARTNCETGPGIARWISGHYADHADASEAMGIDWMTRDELREAIPPSYTEFIGGQLRLALRGPGADTAEAAA